MPVAAISRLKLKKFILDFLITETVMGVTSFQMVIVVVNRTILETEIFWMHYSAVPTETEPISCAETLGEVDK